MNILVATMGIRIITTLGSLGTTISDPFPDSMIL